MRYLIIITLSLLLSSCLSSQSGVDPLGANVTVYRAKNGKVVKHVREDDDKITIVYYSKR